LLFDFHKLYKIRDTQRCRPSKITKTYTWNYALSMMRKEYERAKEFGDEVYIACNSPSLLQTAIEYPQKTVEHPREEKTDLWQESTNPRPEWTKFPMTNTRPATTNPQLETTNPRPATTNPQLETTNPWQEPTNPWQESTNPQRETTNSEEFSPFLDLSRRHFQRSLILEKSKQAQRSLILE
ncbi:hypothetical protein AVEN_96867-1, partial [Araneus ventricosus]